MYVYRSSPLRNFVLLPTDDCSLLRSVTQQTNKQASNESTFHFCVQNSSTGCAKKHGRTGEETGTTHRRTRKNHAHTHTNKSKATTEQRNRKESEQVEQVEQVKQASERASTAGCHTHIVRTTRHSSAPTTQTHTHTHTLNRIH